MEVSNEIKQREAEAESANRCLAFEAKIQELHRYLQIAGSAAFLRVAPRLSREARAEILGLSSAEAIQRCEALILSRQRAASVAGRATRAFAFLRGLLRS
jgi:hypothetical protein